MKLFVNASNQGQPLGQAALAGIRRLRVDGIRTDIVPETAEEQLTEFAGHPDLQLLALVMGGKMPGTADTMVEQARHAATIARENLQMHLLPSPPIFELGNEPNIAGKKHNAIWEKQPELFGKTVARAAREIWEIMGPDTLVVSGGIHNPGEKAQEYLRKAVKHFPPPGGTGRIAVGFHNYAPGMGDPDKPQKGFRTVDDQMASLRGLGYPLFDTESGGHTAPPEGHSEEEVARWLRRRLEINELHGVLGSVIFQWADGPDAFNFEHRFGLTRLDGSLKPAAIALQEFASSRASTTRA